MRSISFSLVSLPQVLTMHFNGDAPHPKALSGAAL
jgi:hypothetical protein